MFIRGSNVYKMLLACRPSDVLWVSLVVLDSLKVKQQQFSETDAIVHDSICASIRGGHAS